MIMCCFQFSVYSVFSPHFCILAWFIVFPCLFYQRRFNAIVYHHNKLIKLKSNVEVNI